MWMVLACWQRWIFFVLSILINCGSCVKINRLQVPKVIRHGNQALLDCDFTLEENEHELVVKWYLNQTLVYQWIPGAKKGPTASGPLKDRLNLEYAASVDANSVHRALHILEAGPDLSGDYTCSVSTLESEDIRKKSMLVVVTERTFVILRLGADEGLFRVQCLADGVFPKPLMSLHTQEREITEAEVTASQKDHLYQVTATVTLPALKDPQEFTCKLHIPQINYTKRLKTIFYPGNAGNKLTIQRWLIISTGIISVIFGLIEYC